MNAWISTGIAAAAVVASVVLAGFERRQRRREFDAERTLREKEFELLRSQVDAEDEARRALSRAYVSVDARAKSGGGDFDSHDFEVTNAGPALVRHLGIRIDRADGGTVSGPVKVDPHILRVGESGRATVGVPRSERLSELYVVVEWVDPEQDEKWFESQVRKERRVEPLQPVSRVP